MQALQFLVKWLTNIIALFVVINIVPGVSASSSQALIVAALIIGLLNAFLRPVLILMTLPFTIATLGLFTLIINGLMFYLASKFVIGFNVLGFWSAFWAALLFSIISFILNLIFATGSGPNFIFRSSGFRANDEIGSKETDDIIDVEGTVIEDSKEGKGE